MESTPEMDGRHGDVNNQFHVFSMRWEVATVCLSSAAVPPMARQGLAALSGH